MLWGCFIQITRKLFSWQKSEILAHFKRIARYNNTITQNTKYSVYKLVTINYIHYIRNINLSHCSTPTTKSIWGFKAGSKTNIIT